MRAIFFALPLILFACSSAPERASEAPAEEKHAAAQTDNCLDNPDLAKNWGECNVKHTVYMAADSFAKCRKAAPKAKGSVVYFDLAIKSDGTVKNAKAKGGAGKLTKCLGGVMKKLQFAQPPAGKEVTITVPYQLEP
jgi:hypothetical protein